MKEPEHKASVTTDWPMLGHDPGHTYCDGSIVQPPLEKAWEFQADGGIKSSPVSAYGVVFFGCDDKNLYALDASTGQLKWKFKTQGKIVTSPVVADKVVYVASQDKNLYAINAWTGRKLWEFTTGKHICSSPAAAYGTVFFGSEDKHVYALDTNGQSRWRLNTDCKIFSAPTVVDGKVLIAGLADRERSMISVIDAATGSILWEKDGLFTHLYLQSPTVTNRDGKNYMFFPTVNSIDILDLDSGRSFGSIGPNFKGSIKPFSLATNSGFLFVGIGLKQEQQVFHIFTFLLIHLHKSSSYLVHMFERNNSLPAISRDFMFTIGEKDTLYGISTTRLKKRLLFKSKLNWWIPPSIATGMVFAVESRLLRKGRIHAFKRVNHPYNKLEITNRIAEAPAHIATIRTSSIIWPQMCCLCCGPAEKKDTISKSILLGKRTVHYSLKVPYCENCHEKTRHWFRAKEKPGVEFGYGYDLARGMLTLVFRNEKYWGLFMELNHLR